LTKATEQAEVWEKVIRKLRAGVMPPPDIPRPPLPDYEALRDWLENEIDRVAPTRTAPGSVVLHRLNRTEYANAIRDLLDLHIDARHTFPADGEYRFSIQNFGVGSFIPGEQLVLLIDGERAHVWPYRGVGLAVGMTAETDGTLEVTVPVRAGSRLVGATFLATNYRPSLDIIRQYDRKSLENNTIPQLQYYPAVGYLRIQGPFN